MSWREFWNGEHSIYVSPRHMLLHYRGIAADLAALVPSPAAQVLDHGSGEALAADRVAAVCGRLFLCESAANVRARLAERFAAVPNIEIVAPDGVAALPEASLDLVIANSLIQYLTRDELAALLALWRGRLKPGGILVLADVIPPDLGPVSDAAALLGFAWRGGFLLDALKGLLRTAFSDYRRLRAQYGLATYDEASIAALLRAAGFDAVRRRPNLGHNPHRMTLVAQSRGETAPV